MTPERLAEIRASYAEYEKFGVVPGGIVEMLRDLLAHVDALENGPQTVRSHLAVRKRDMKVFDCDAAERLARLVLEGFFGPENGPCFHPARAVSCTVPGAYAGKMVDEARAVLGEKP